MLKNNKILQDPLEEKTLPLFAEKLGINHWSSTQWSTPDGAWLFKYGFLNQEQRRLLLGSNSAMEGGKRVGDALQRIYADTIYKISPTTKKVAPTTNEKISYDNSVQEQIELLKEYEPADDKDAEKKIKYLEELPNVINNAHLGLTELALASPVTCERQISISADNLKAEDFSFMRLSLPLLATVGRVDFDFGIAGGSTSLTNRSKDSVVPVHRPAKIVELKTKWSKLGKTRKDGSRGFIGCSSPANASFNHLVQCAVYAAYWNFEVPIYLLYATDKDYKIFDSTNCKHLTVEGMKRNLQIMFNTFIRREKILALHQELTKEEIIQNAAQIIDPMFDHPYAWNQIPEDLLKEAKELWRVN